MHADPALDEAVRARIVGIAVPTDDQLITLEVADIPALEARAS